MDNLPVILITAANETAAVDVISELIDNDVSGEYAQEPEPHDRVWRLVNKYYTADVRVYALADHERRPPAPPAHLIEAQVIHVTQQELEGGGDGGDGGVRQAQERAARGPWQRVAVRAVLAECAREAAAAALAAWAAAPPHALLVARAERAPPGEPARRAFADAYGVQRLRDALHAHTWRNLRRTDGAAAAPLTRFDDAEPSPEQQRRLVEQTRALAEALQAAGALRGAAGAGGAARLERAESVLLAVCRAAGLRPDELD